MTHTRNPLDFYTTPSNCTEALVTMYAEVFKGKYALEPYAGDGAIADILQHYVCNLVTNDINNQYGMDYSVDFLELNGDIMREQATSGRKIDLIVTNPPYTDVEEHVRACLSVADEVFMLLRISFLEPTKKRRDILQHNLVSVNILPKRPRFRTDTNATDSVTSAWFRFKPEHINHPKILYLSY